MAGQVVVATAGWSVKEWYDEGVEPRERLRALAAHLDGVEVDSSFYALPSASTVQRWAEITPDGFTFAAKLHRALSRHAAPLDSLPRDLREDVEVTERGRIVLTDELQEALCDRTLKTFEPLIGRLTCFVLQLTPGLRARRPHAGRARAGRAGARARAGGDRAAPPRLAAPP